MPTEYKVDEKTGIMYVRRWGAITIDDEAAALKERSVDVSVIPNISVIVDCREVVPPDSAEVVRYIADRTTAIAAELDCGPVAIVVGNDVGYGMARMYMGLTALKHPNTEVFRSYNDALKWLQVQSKKSGLDNPDS